MNEDLDDILRRVASGELTPEAALPLIDAATSASAPPPTPPGEGSPHWGTPEAGSAGEAHGSDTPKGSDRERPRSVRIAVSYRSADVIADPSVDQVVVVGDHTVRRDGDVLVVESLALPGFGEFGSAREEQAERGERGERGGPFSFASLPRSLAWARAMKDQHLVIRVNPALPIEVDAAATGLRIRGCEGGARIRLVASSLKADRLRGPLDLDALSSSVKGTIVITGESRIACESASVKLALLPGSDVRMSATNRLGKVVLPESRSKTGLSDAQTIESVVGDGSGRLAVDAVMSSVMLTYDVSTAGRASA
jgi:hypothetical protein